MSLNAPSRRALTAASQSLLRTQLPSTSSPSLTAAAAAAQRRAISWSSIFGRNRGKKAAGAEGGADGAAAWAKDMTSAKSRQALSERLTESRLSQGSLFAEELQQHEQPRQPSEKAKERRRPGLQTVMGGSLVRDHTVRAVDPDPRSRVRWQRKKIIQRVARGLSPTGAETRAEVLARTERQLTSRSEALPTSVKKLMFLARQVAGKTVEDALAQMRFSKKKMAKEVRWQLELARDQAIVERGMGLGRVTGEAAAVVPAGDGKNGESKAIKIQTKDGKWLTITDPTSLYIDQAWVGKGHWRHAAIDYRARGRRFIMWSPTTYLTLVIKEEKTRIRQHQERVDKEAKKAPWVHLPNRPVTAQRPYYSW